MLLLVVVVVPLLFLYSFTYLLAQGAVELVSSPISFVIIMPTKGYFTVRIYQTYQMAKRKKTTGD